jgi:hypothetical protein
MADVVPPMETPGQGNYWVLLEDAINYFRYGLAHPDKILPGAARADIICVAILESLERQQQACDSCHLGAQVIFGEDDQPNRLGVYVIHENQCPRFDHASGTIIKGRKLLYRNEVTNA